VSATPFDPWKELRQRGRFALVFVFLQCVGLVIIFLFLWLTILLTGHTPR
jgi:hypothetical protein